MHGLALAPETRERGLARGDTRDGIPPDPLIDDDTRPGPMILDPGAHVRECGYKRHRRHPLLALLVVFGLLVAFGALLLRLNEIAFGEPIGKSAPVKASYVPLYAHLGLVLAAGIHFPAPLVAWFQTVARLLG